MDIISTEARLPQPTTKTLLRPHQVVQHQEDIKQCEADLRNANIQKKGDVTKRKRKLEAQYLDQAPQPITNGALRDKVAKRITQLKDEIRVGLPTAEEMRKATPQTVEQHRKWERLNKKKVQEWRNLERQLHTDTSDPDTHDRALGDVETLRPASAQDRLRTDGFIGGAMTYGAVPQENWDLAFEGKGPENTALKQAERVAQAPKPKKEMTPEQKAHRAAILAKARAARKPKASPVVEEAAPVQVVPAEEVTE